MTRRLIAICAATLLLGAGCGGPAKPVATPKKLAEAKKAAAAKAAKAKAKAKAKAAALLAPAKPDPIPSACQAFHDQIIKSYEPYLAAYSNVGLELSPKRRKLLFLSNRDGGSMQLYIADARKPRAAPTKLAPSKERVGQARFVPGGKQIVFSRDVDNNERYQLYRVGVDGKGLTNLTKAPQRFYQLPEITEDGKTIIGFRGVHKSPTFELYRMPIAGGEQKVIFTGKGFHYISDLSKDGKRALVVHITSLSASELLLVDLATGKAKRLAPTAGVKAHAQMGVFAPDGKHVYITTNEGTPRMHLRKVLLATNKEVKRYVDKTAEVGFVQAKGRTVVVALDAGSHKAIAILDRRSLKPRPKVRLPLGSASMGMLSRDGKQLVVTFSNPTTPRDVYALSTRSGRAKLLRKDKRQGLAQVAKVEAKVERVPTFDALKVPINVYLPTKRAAGAKLPVLVSVHGGPAGASRVAWSPFIAFWISRGFAVVEPNVRGSTGFGKDYEQADNLKKRMDAVKDLGAVNDWIRKQPWADGDKQVVFGGSYGGYMTYMALGHQPKKWALGVGAVGVVNLRTFLKNTTGAIRHVFREEFGVLPRDAAFLDSVSPITVVDRVERPALIYQGATDPRVPRSEQDQMVRALRKQGVVVEYMIAMDEGHSLSHKHTKTELVARMARFMDQHLGRPLPAACKASAAGAKRLLDKTKPAKPAKPTKPAKPAK
jgi:dipeptidyl aminopeptidase/acylaminoacyl peptidase